MKITVPFFLRTGRLARFPFGVAPEAPTDALGARPGWTAPSAKEPNPGEMASFFSDDDQWLEFGRFIGWRDGV